MGSCVPKPICPITNPISIDPGTLVRHRSPAPGPQCVIHPTRKRPGLRVGTLVFDEQQILDFLYTVAHARMMERFTHTTNWKEYNESTVINVIYTVFPFGKPGWVEVETGDIHRVLDETKKEWQRLQEEFLLACSQGPQHVTKWLSYKEQARESALDAVRTVYQDAAEINEAVQHEAKRAVARLTLIKAASTITVKALSLAVGGWPSFLVGTGYDVSLDLIKDWDKAPDAKLIGVANKTGEKLAKKAVKDAAKNMSNIYKNEGAAPAQKAEWLSKRVEGMAEDLDRMGSAERAKYLRDTRRLARAEAEAARAKWAGRAFGSVKYVFFAWDVYKAGKDANETFHQAGYDNSWAAIKDAL
jgi:hypothetical protein